MTAPLTASDVRALLRIACIQAGSQKAWAEKHGVSRAYVCDVVNGRREPSPAVLKPLGLRLHQVERLYAADGA